MCLEITSMKKLLYVFFLIIAFQTNLFAQPGAKWMKLEGNVVSVSMKSPLKARLTLESMPYGGDNRVFTSDETDGSFSFKVKEGKEYKVLVEAEGYLSVEEVININKGMGKKLYELVPSGENTLLRLNINFEEGKATIITESFSELDKLVNMMKAYPEMEIQLEGHTDFRGSSTANFKLSERRVEAVKEYLSQQSIDEKRIKTKAFGGTEPLTRENTEEAKLTNRRVEARILKIE